MYSGIEKEKLVKATIHTTTQGAEILSALLPVLGIESLSIEDPSDLDFIIASKDKLAWDFVEGADGLLRSARNDKVDYEVLVSFWLEASAVNTDRLLQDVREALLKLKSDEQYGEYGEDADFGRLWMHTESDDEDWIEKYRESFRTFSPCEGVVVSPPWEADLPVEETLHGEEYRPIRIIIDPGMAFGTGSHETTAMCLSKLKELIDPGSPVKSGAHVLDVGAGSGILSIAAALLGAESVCAVEIDEDAAASARANFALNGLDDKILLIVGDITEPGFLQSGVLSESRVFSEGVRFDLIVANLSCALIEKILPVFADILIEGGQIILSGLLDAQEERVLKAVGKADLKTTEICRSGEWIALVVSKAGELSTAEVSR